jgi:hypothetical protein
LVVRRINEGSKMVVGRIGTDIKKFSHATSSHVGAFGVFGCPLHELDEHPAQIVLQSRAIERDLGLGHVDCVHHV